MQDSAEKIRTNSLATYYRRPLHMDVQKLDDLQEPIYNSSVPIQDVAWKTCNERWTIETGERWPARSKLAVWRDDDDDD